MTGILVDERDLNFVLFDVLNVQDLARHQRFEHVDRETVEVLLGEAAKLAEQRLYPLNIEGDKVGTHFEDGEVRVVPGMREAYRDFVTNGWLTQSEDVDIGGQGLPEIIKFATHEMFLAANFPFMCFVNLTHDAAKLIELFGSEAQKKVYLPKVYGGDWTGTMCLTEPGAGSDVGALKTRAGLAEDGHYRLKGQKIYITNGDHDLAENIVHLVLARIEGDPEGTRGLSIFIVPKHRVEKDGSRGPRNDVTCIGIETKMGLHASPTTTLSFGDNGECHAYLLGQPRQGIQIMFHMMNQSRLEVGLFGLGICSASYRHALAFARERMQGQGYCGETGQVSILEHPDVRRSLLTMKAYVEGMRTMLYYCGYAMDRLALAEDESDAREWQGIIDLLIPIIKAHPTEKGVEFSSLSLQIHGGAGYTSAYPLEQFMRDAKVACIFEGTTGIQGIDFALRKVRMRGGSVFHDFLVNMDGIVEQVGELPGWKPYVDQFHKTRDAVLELPKKLAAGAEEDQLRDQLLAATPFMEATGDLMVAYFLLWNALVADRKIAEFGGLPEDPDLRAAALERDTNLAHLAGKTDVARHFISNVLPVVEGKVASLTWMDSSALSIFDGSL